MTRNFLLPLGLVIAVSTGCTPTKTAQSNKDRVYYHDRQTSTGTNIPRSYGNSAAANAPQAGMSGTDDQQLVEMQRNGAVAHGSGGQ